MTYSLGGLDLGTITNEEVNKDSQLFQQPLPKNDSDKLIALDLFGVQKTISISGVKEGTTSDLQNFISTIQNAINGDQSTIAYTSDLHGPIQVLIQNFRWRYEEGSPNMVRYDLSLLEAAG